MIETTSAAEQAALAEFPELRRLIVLRQTGRWMFLPHISDGQVKVVQGVRTWPHGWADALGVRYTTDAQAVRCDPVGYQVWKRDGGLVEVVDALLELPAPGESGAPRLAIGRGPRLWIPQ